MRAFILYSSSIPTTNGAHTQMSLSPLLFYNWPFPFRFPQTLNLLWFALFLLVYYASASFSLFGVLMFDGEESCI